MSLRWRLDGRLMCAAKTAPRDTDTYIDDRLHHQLYTVLGVIVPDELEHRNGLWHWVQVRGGYVPSWPQVFGDIDPSDLTPTTSKETSQ